LKIYLILVDNKTLRLLKHILATKKRMLE